MNTNDTRNTSWSNGVLGLQRRYINPVVELILNAEHGVQLLNKQVYCVHKHAATITLLL